MKSLLSAENLRLIRIGYNLDMANLPVLADSSSLSEADERFFETVIDHLAGGKTPKTIAFKVYPRDRNKRRKLEHRIFKLAAYDANFQSRVALRSKASLVLDMPAIASAVGHRAKRGRIDAAKLAMEASGFHNPKVKHEHSGEIKVKLEMPRPQFDHEVPATDAEEVEDET